MNVLASNVRRFLRSAFALALAWVHATVALASTTPGDPMGPEFRVNTDTSGYRSNPAVATNAEGDFVVVWVDGRNSDNGADIYAQSYAADGTARGGEFLVNSETYGNQGSPSVAIDAHGAFVVVWEVVWGIRAQRYAADGTPVGNEFAVNTNRANYPQSLPSVDMNASGDYVVAWQGTRDDSSSGIHVRRYAADGTPQGDEFGVNSTTAPGDPSVAMDANGNFVVAWAGADDQREVEPHSPNPISCLGGYCYPFPAHVRSFFSVYAQRFAADGTHQGGEFIVNSTTIDDQLDPAVAMDAGGAFVVVWQSFGQDGSDWGIYARRYAADGTAQDGEFPINTTTAGPQGSPAVAMDAMGGSVVVWQSDMQDGDGFRIFAQRYAANGTPAGNEFLVSSGAADSQHDPAVAMAAGGDFVTTWTSNGQDGIDQGIYAQRYAGSGVDNDAPPPSGTLSFSGATYSANEAGPTATITINRTGGSAGLASIQYATSNGAATAGADYTATSGALNWADGDSAPKTFTVSISDDTADEPDESVNLTLSNASGAALGAPSNALLTIVDNDAPPPPPPSGTLSFSSASFSVNEAGPTATISINRMGGSAGAASVQYATSNGTATADADYTASSGTLNWAAGDAAPKTFTVDITDDTADEPDETVTLTLFNVSGATLGAPNSAALTIVDNDAPTPAQPSGSGDPSGGGGSASGGGGPLSPVLSLLFGIVALARSWSRREYALEQSERRRKAELGVRRIRTPPC